MSKYFFHYYYTCLITDTNEIEKLEKIVKKAIEIAIKYENKIVDLYDNTQESVEKVKSLVEKLTYILAKFNIEQTEDETELEESTEIE